MKSICVYISFIDFKLLLCFVNVYIYILYSFGKVAVNRKRKKGGVVVREGRPH